MYHRNLFTCFRFDVRLSNGRRRSTAAAAASTAPRRPLRNRRRRRRRPRIRRRRRRPRRTATCCRRSWDPRRPAPNWWWCARAPPKSSSWFVIFSILTSFCTLITSEFVLDGQVLASGQVRRLTNSQVAQIQSAVRAKKNSSSAAGSC